MTGGAPSSAFRSRSFDSAATGDGRLGFAVMRNVARLNETATWPLLSKNASGFVSSFGELTGVTHRPGVRSDWSSFPTSWGKWAPRRWMRGIRCRTVRTMTSRSVST